MKKLSAGALALALIGAVAFNFWQHQQIKRLIAEQAVLRDQIGQAASLRDEVQRLTAQIKANAEGSEADRLELMRLRSQSTRLRQVEQENAQLKTELQRLASQLSQATQADALSQQQKKSLPPEAYSSSLPPGVTDLGTVEFSNGTPMRLDLGAGKNCVLTMTVLTNGLVQMVFASESKGPDGHTIQKESTCTAFLDRMILMTALDDVMIALKPTLKAQ